MTLFNLSCWSFHAPLPHPSTTSIMSVFNAVKNVLATIDEDQPERAEFLGDDEDRSYDIFINPQPPTQVRISNYAGDIYVQIDRESPEALCSIHICDEHKAWVQWQPHTIIKVTVLGKTLYPVACPKHGVRYVGTAQHATRISGEAFQDVGHFAEVLATTCGYPTHNKRLAGAKRPMEMVVTSPPRKKRARIPRKPQVMGKVEQSKNNDNEKEILGRGSESTLQGIEQDNVKGKEKGKGKGKAKGKGKGKGKERETERSERDTSGGDRNDMDWESLPTLDTDVPSSTMVVGSEPMLDGASEEVVAGVQATENEGNNVPTSTTAVESGPMVAGPNDRVAADAQAAEDEEDEVSARRHIPPL